MATSLPVITAEMRADLVERIGTPLSAKMLNGMIQSSRRVGDRLFPSPPYDGEDAAQDIAQVARMAELFTITPEMLDLIRHASRSMPPQVLLQEDLPSQSGFLLLPHPMMMIDVNGLEVPVDAIMWHEETLGRPGDNPGAGLPAVARGVLFYVFTTNGGPKDVPFHRLPKSIQEDIRVYLPKLGLFTAHSLAFGRASWELAPSEVEGMSSEERVTYTRRVMGSVHDGMMIDPEEPPGPDGSVRVRTLAGYEVRVVPDQFIQFMAAYFHFMSSELSSRDRVELPKSMLKWLRRLEMPTGPVTVVRLRRRAASAAGSSGWNLTYQFVRRGHWRRQPYGSRTSPVYRWIWIAPHLVGPADGPLRQRDVVNILAR